MKKIVFARRTVKIGFKGYACDKDEAVTSPEFTQKAYNVTFGDGTLRGEIGIGKANAYYPGGALSRSFPDLPQGVTIKDVALYRRVDEMTGGDDRIVILSGDKSLYYCKLYTGNSWVKIDGVTVAGAVPSTANYNYNGKDVLLIASEEDRLMILDGDSVTDVENAPRLDTLAVHKERVYGAVNGNGGEVWFSDDFNPANWNASLQEGGFIKFADEDGDVIRLVSFLDYLYIFRERGIYRLTAYADQTEFSLKRLFTNTGRIYKRTIAPCGDRILFYADDGLYSFDGYSAQRIAENMPKLSGNEFMAAAFCSGFYYLSGYAADPEMNLPFCINNCIVRYGVKDKSIAVVGPIDAARLVPVCLHAAADVFIADRKEQNNFLLKITKDGKFLGTGTVKTYKSPVNDLGTDGCKTVRQVTLTCSSPVTITVITDGERTTAEFGASKYPQTAFIGKSGRKVGFELRCSAVALKASPAVVKMDVWEGV